MLLYNEEHQLLLYNPSGNRKMKFSLLGGSLRPWICVSTGGEFCGSHLSYSSVFSLLCQKLLLHSPLTQGEKLPFPISLSILTCFLPREGTLTWLMKAWYLWRQLLATCFTFTWFCYCFCSFYQGGYVEEATWTFFHLLCVVTSQISHKGSGPSSLSCSQAEVPPGCGLSLRHKPKAVSPWVFWIFWQLHMRRGLWSSTFRWVKPKSIFAPILPTSESQGLSMSRC